MRPLEFVALDILLDRPDLSPLDASARDSTAFLRSPLLPGSEVGFRDVSAAAPALLVWFAAFLNSTRGGESIRSSCEAHSTPCGGGLLLGEETRA